MLDATEVAPRIKPYLLSQLTAERVALQRIKVTPAGASSLVFEGNSEQTLLDFSKLARRLLERLHSRGEILVCDLEKSGETSWRVRKNGRWTYVRGLCWKQRTASLPSTREAALISLRKMVPMPSKILEVLARTVG